MEKIIYHAPYLGSSSLNRRGSKIMRSISRSLDRISIDTPELLNGLESSTSPLFPKAVQKTLNSKSNKVLARILVRLLADISQDRILKDLRPLSPSPKVFTPEMGRFSGVIGDSHCWDESWKLGQIESKSSPFRSPLRPNSQNIKG
ncbi:hypothetical protein DID88_007695 [Monilinia fructigena]|uniref:Uncharacterized protein n=1 Tax=Monilinia fructigena TaxID=38457 RepID=A0A395J5G6_9HELO|nr:hypothetical protein DID88_007695 [Monilinia fructigena]